MSGAQGQCRDAQGMAERERPAAGTVAPDIAVERDCRRDGRQVVRKAATGGTPGAGVGWSRTRQRLRQASTRWSDGHRGRSRPASISETLGRCVARSRSGRERPGPWSRRFARRDLCRGSNPALRAVPTSQPKRRSNSRCASPARSGVVGSAAGELFNMRRTVLVNELAMRPQTPHLGRSKGRPHLTSSNSTYGSVLDYRTRDRTDVAAPGGDGNLLAAADGRRAKGIDSGSTIMAHWPDSSCTVRQVRDPAAKWGT